MPYIGNVLTSFAVETGNINDQAVTAPKLSATGGTDGQVLALDSGGNLVWSSDPAGQWVTNGSDIYFDRASTNTNVATAGGIFVANTNTTTNNVVALSFTAEPTDVAHPAAKIGAVFTDRTTDSEDTELYFSVVGAGTASEALRIDSSGRLLVGTSTAAQNGTAIFEGNNAGATGAGIVHLAKGSATPADGDFLGTLSFTDSGHVQAARVSAHRDGGTWTSGSSQPTRLVFSTTADGASALTERMLISANGNLAVDTDTLFVDAVNNRVGVGTASPSTPLHVEGTDGSAALRIGNTTGNTNLQITANEDNDITLQFRDGGSERSLVFSGNTERMRIDSNGRLLVGTNSSISNRITGQLQIVGTGDDSCASLTRYSSATTGSPILTIGRSKSSTKGTNTVVVNGDKLGAIEFTGADGTNFVPAASVSSFVDTDPGAGDMPGNLIFSTTPNNSSTLTERFRINNQGGLGIGGENFGTSGQVLTSRGGSAPEWATPAGFTRSSVLTLNGNASVDFTIPADVNVVELIARNFSSSGNDEIRVQVGDSDGVKTSSYRSGTSLVFSGSTTEIHSASAGWVLGTVEAARTYECQYRLRRMGNGRWHCSWNGMFNNSQNVLAGTVQGAGVAPSINAGGLTTVRFAVGGGTFDDGDASVLYI